MKTSCGESAPSTTAPPIVVKKNLHNLAKGWKPYFYVMSLVSDNVVTCKPARESSPMCGKLRRVLTIPDLR